jgi:hypothetical protein
VSADGHVHDGPVGATASGYSVIKAASFDAAVKIAQSCPVLKSGAQISVYDSMAMM